MSLRRADTHLLFPIPPPKELAADAKSDNSAFLTMTVLSSLLMGIAIYLLSHNIWASTLIAVSISTGSMAIANFVNGCTKNILLHLTQSKSEE